MTSFMASTIAFEWCMAAWWSLCKNYSTTRDHRSHVIFIIGSWSNCKRHALSGAVSFFASFCTVRRMIDAARLIFIRFCRKQWKTFEYIDMDRIKPFFRQMNIDNQPEISRRPRGRRNKAVNAKFCFFNDFVSKYPRSLTAFLAILSCAEVNSKTLMKACPQHHRHCHKWKWSGSFGESALVARCWIQSELAHTKPPVPVA